MSKQTLEQCRTGVDFVRYVGRHSAVTSLRQGGGSHLIVRTARGTECVPVHARDLPTGTRRAIVKRLAAIGIMLLPFVCAWLALQ